MFSSLYLKTTNPHLHWRELLQPPLLFQIVGSILFHTAVYAFSVNLVFYIFFNRILSYNVNLRLTGSLFIIMWFGFFARWIHVKDVFKSYNQNMEKTRNHLDKQYITWIFIS